VGALGIGRGDDAVEEVHSGAVLSQEGTHNGKAATAGTIGRVAPFQQPLG
jgi:hypothetical protein